MWHHCSAIVPSYLSKLKCTSLLGYHIFRCNIYNGFMYLTLRIIQPILKPVCARSCLKTPTISWTFPRQRSSPFPHRFKMAAFTSANWSSSRRRIASNSSSISTSSWQRPRKALTWMRNPWRWRWQRAEKTSSSVYWKQERRNWRLCDTMCNSTRRLRQSAVLYIQVVDIEI